MIMICYRQLSKQSAKENFPTKNLRARMQIDYISPIQTNRRLFLPWFG